MLIRAMFIPVMRNTWSSSSVQETSSQLSCLEGIGIAILVLILIVSLLIETLKWKMDVKLLNRILLVLVLSEFIACAFSLITRGTL